MRALHQSLTTLDIIKIKLKNIGREADLYSRRNDL